MLENLQTLTLQAPMRCGNQTDELSPFFAVVMGLMDSLRAAYAFHDLKERFFRPLLLRGLERAGSPVVVKIWIVNKRVMTLFLNHDEMPGQKENTQQIHAIDALLRSLVDTDKSWIGVEPQLWNSNKNLRSFAATPTLQNCASIG